MMEIKIYKIYLILLFTVISHTPINAQSYSDDLEKVKKIELLESTRQDIKTKFLDENTKYLKSDYGSKLLDKFYTNNSIIWVDYSTGDCSNEDEDWSVMEGKVKEISITPKDYLPVEKSGINYKDFKKERPWGKNNKEKFIFHSKDKGIAISSSGILLRSIVFIPSKTKYEKLCDKDEVKSYYYGKSWNRNPIMKKNHIHYNEFPRVTEVKLSRYDIHLDCELLEVEERRTCLDNQKISVQVYATDAENDVLTYSYEVTGGKIIGQGAKVFWDLSGVRSGNYKITAYVDDGCGLYCGKWMTKTIMVN